MLARDVMQTHVITVEPDLPLVDAHRLFVEEEIGGAPVLDETGRLLGVVTSSDLLRGVEEEHGRGTSEAFYLREHLEFSGPDWSNAPQDFQDRLASLTVGDVMTTRTVTVTPETSVAEVAGLMRRHRIHRVLVVQDDGLAGIISTFDLIAALEKTPPRKAGRG